MCCIGEKKTVSLQYNTGLLGQATPPGNIAGNGNIASEIYYFTTELESWKVLSVEFTYLLIPTIVPNATGAEQNTFQFWLECMFHNRGITRFYESGTVENKLRLDGLNQRQLVFSRDKVNFDFSNGLLIAQGLTNFRTWWFMKTSGSGAVGLNIRFDMLFNLERHS